VTSVVGRKRRSAAERMRMSRVRRHDGVSCVLFEVRDCEIDRLVTYGLLNPAQRNDRRAIAVALGNLMHELWSEPWPIAPRG
jgi:hypothetical protein